VRLIADHAVEFWLSDGHTICWCKRAEAVRRINAAAYAVAPAQHG
jgi:hypothetical protein